MTVTTDPICDWLRSLLARGCGLPAAREHAQLLLRIRERQLSDNCASGCTAPAAREVEGERLCEQCFQEMTR